MCERKVTGTSDWTKYEIVLDVPDSASKIGFGAILSGEGKLWLDAVAFDVVGNDVSSTDCPCSQRHREPAEPLLPSNLNFEQV